MQCSWWGPTATPPPYTSTRWPPPGTSPRPPMTGDGELARRLRVLNATAAIPARHRLLAGRRPRHVRGGDAQHRQGPPVPHDLATPWNVTSASHEPTATRYRQATESHRLTTPLPSAGIALLTRTVHPHVRGSGNSPISAQGSTSTRSGHPLGYHHDASHTDGDSRGTSGPRIHPFPRRCIAFSSPDGARRCSCWGIAIFDIVNQYDLGSAFPITIDDTAPPALLLCRLFNGQRHPGDNLQRDAQRDHQLRPPAHP